MILLTEGEHMNRTIQNEALKAVVKMLTGATVLCSLQLIFLVYVFVMKIVILGTGCFIT